MKIEHIDNAGSSIGLYIVLLTIGYLVSRGPAKAGSRDSSVI